MRMSADERREKNRLRKRVERAHRRDDHSLCRPNCDEPFDRNIPGTIPDTTACRHASAACFEEPSTVTFADWKARNTPAPTFVLSGAVGSYGLAGDNLIVGRRTIGDVD